MLLCVGVSEATSEPVWCGRPPECQCLTELKVVQCLDIKTFPPLPETVKKQTRTVVITGNKMVALPRSLLNRTEFQVLEKIKVILTKIKCADINEARNYHKDLLIFSQCQELDEKTETTTPSVIIVSGKPPSWTEQETTGDNGTITWIMTSVRPRDISTQSTAMNDWITSGVILTGINLLAVLMIILFVIIRYRRQCYRSSPQTNIAHIEMMSEPVREPVPVETIGSYSSSESTELYSVPSTSRQHLKRKSVEKEL